MEYEELENCVINLWNELTDGIADEEYIAEVARNVFGSSEKMKSLGLYYEPEWFN